ncbi:hypothetical protein D9757_010961 [Collybiopsis confluens]|uniref:Uncharacterized protein n=1 Tax=Collybiopsis confluens TaxID=2823264 RepID=A0A8H5GJZ0_9AGAR|nr:hypothetical protein D9757_010961 [Collybiopsis confluens]
MRELEVSQINHYYSYVLTIDPLAARESPATDACEALDAVSEPNGGKNPDAIFMLAGSCHPRFFIEETEETMKTQIDHIWKSVLNLEILRLFQGAQEKSIFLSSLKEPQDLKVSYAFKEAQISGQFLRCLRSLGVVLALLQKLSVECCYC